MPPGTHSHFQWGQAYTYLHIWEHSDGGSSGGSTHTHSHRVPWDTPTASWSHGVTQWLRHTGTHSPEAPSLSQRTHRLTSPGMPGMHARPTHTATRPLQPPLESLVRCLTSPPPHPMVQARPWGEAKVELPTETPGGSSQDSVGGQQTARGQPHCSWHSFTQAYPATPWAPDNASPAPRCPLPTSQRSILLVPSEGSISLNCSQLSRDLLYPGALSLHLSQPPDLPVGPPSPSAALPTPILTPSPGCTGSPPPAVGCWHQVGGLAPQRRG